MFFAWESFFLGFSSIQWYIVFQYVENLRIQFLINKFVFISARIQNILFSQVDNITKMQRFSNFNSLHNIVFINSREMNAN